MSEQPKTCTQCNAELSVDSLSSLCPQCLLQIGFETQPVAASPEQSSSSYQPTFVPPTCDELAPHFPQLEILSVLGHGGMGAVLPDQADLDDDGGEAADGDDDALSEMVKNAVENALRRRKADGEPPEDTPA